MPFLFIIVMAWIKKQSNEKNIIYLDIYRVSIRSDRL